MTLSEIKDQYAKELGYKNFRDLQYDIAWWDELRDVEDFMDEIALRYFEANKGEYATACCKATQEKCAEEAEPSALLYKAIMQSSNIVIL